MGGLYSVISCNSYCYLVSGMGISLNKTNNLIVVEIFLIVCSFTCDNRFKHQEYKFYRFRTFFNRQSHLISTLDLIMPLLNVLDVLPFTVYATAILLENWWSITNGSFIILNYYKKGSTSFIFLSSRCVLSWQNNT